MPFGGNSVIGVNLRVNTASVTPIISLDEVSTTLSASISTDLKEIYCYVLPSTFESFVVSQVECKITS